VRVTQAVRRGIICAFYVGDCSWKSIKELWGNLPEIYQQHATFLTEQYDVHHGVMPAERYQAMTKQARKTNHIKRFNNTLRQHISCLGRGSLVFSKKLATPIGAMKFFICHDNLEKAPALLCVALPHEKSVMERTDR
jgi:insertion element IS1 protein InsB